MFGILKPQANLLTREEYRQYVSAYCNLCGLLHHRYGLKSRFLVLHDVATLWWLLDHQNKSRQLRMGNCVRGGVGKLKDGEVSELQQLLAAISVYTISIKVKDDMQDDGGLQSRILHWSYQSVFEEARQDLRNLDFDVDQMESILAQQQAVEARREPNFESAAEPTAQAYGLLATEIVERCESRLDAAQARQIGERLGRSVYLVDAIQDFEADAGTNYNPLCYAVGKQISTLPSRIKNDVLLYLGECLKQGRETIGSHWKSSWHAVERALLASAGVRDQRSVTLYLGCCIPCGPGGVYVDDKDCAGCEIACCVCGFALFSLCCGN